LKWEWILLIVSKAVSVVPSLALVPWPRDTTSLPGPLRRRPPAFVRIEIGNLMSFVATPEGYAVFVSGEILAWNGWGSQSGFVVVTPRDVATVPELGTIPTVDPARFGPLGTAGTRN